MSLYLLDTNTVSHFLNVQSPRHNLVIRHIGALADSETVMVSILAIYEYSYGIENAPDEIKKRQLQRALAQLLQDIPAADLSIAVAAKYGELKYRSKRQYNAVTTDLKKIYPSATEEEALGALQEFSERWDQKYPRINKSWRANWENLNTLFEYPPQIRKAIYTTNAIESLNSAIRKATKRRKVFPTDDSARKVIYLAIQEEPKKWSMPIRDWKAALNRFMILFNESLIQHTGGVAMPRQSISLTEPN